MNHNMTLEEKRRDFTDRLKLLRLGVYEPMRDVGLSGASHSVLDAASISADVGIGKNPG